MASLNNDQQTALDEVLNRASTDREFRTQLLADPRSTIESAYGVTMPDNVRVRFLERDNATDQIIVLPDFVAEAAELTDEELAAVAGGEDMPQWCIGYSCSDTCGNNSCGQSDPVEVPPIAPIEVAV